MNGIIRNEILISERIELTKAMVILVSQLCHRFA